MSMNPTQYAPVFYIGEPLLNTVCIQETILADSINNIMEAVPVPPGQVPSTATNLYIGSVLVFSRSDFVQLQKASSWLPGGSIDGCVMLIQHLFDDTSQSSCAIFPNYTWQAFVKGFSDDILWTSACRSRYWEKDTWMMPMNEGGNHWVLGIVNISGGKVSIFDSIFWKKDIMARSQVRKTLGYPLIL